MLPEPINPEPNSDLAETNNCYGYHIDQRHQVMTEALQVVFQLVRESKNKSEDMHYWAANTIQKADKFLSQNSQEEILKRDGWRTLHSRKILGGILGLENEISRVIRNYFTQITDLLYRIKIMNPPFTSEELEKHLDEILEHRRQTMEVLHPLGEIIDRLAKLKTFCLIPETQEPPNFKIG